LFDGSEKLTLPGVRPLLEILGSLFQRLLLLNQLLPLGVTSGRAQGR
jgi:hypothetical protein